MASTTNGFRYPVASDAANGPQAFQNLAEDVDTKTAVKAASNTFTANQVIQVTDNTNPALRVTQLGTGDALRVEDSANPDTTPTVIDASGNVGIGTATPFGRMSVESPAAGAVWEVAAKTAGVSNESGLFVDASNNMELAARNGSGTLNVSLKSSGTSFVKGGSLGVGTDTPGTVLATSGTTGITVDTTAAAGLLATTYRADATGNRVILRKSRGATVGTNTVVQAGDTMGDVVFRGYDGAAYTDSAYVTAQVDGTPSSGVVPGRLMFQTANTSGAITERMRIDNAGLITGSGASLGAWTAYTPTLGGTGWAIGDGTITGEYCQIGKIVLWRASVTFGASSTFGASAAPTISLPVTAASGFKRSAVSMGALVTDTSASAEYSLLCLAPSTSAISLATRGTLGVAAIVTATNPITFASSDVIIISGTYQAA